MSVTKYAYQTADAQIALTEFRMRLEAALATAVVDTTLLDLGDRISGDAPRYRYPIPLHAIAFEEFEGDMPYSDLDAYNVEVIPKTYAAGVKADARQVASPEWIGWGRAPEAMAEEASAHTLKLLAAAVETPGNSFDGVGFFATNHPVNPKDGSIQFAGSATWSNYGAALTLTAPNFATAMEYMPAIPNCGGNSMGLIPAIMMVPSVLLGQARAIINGQIVSDGAGAGISNIWQNAVKVVANPYLTVAAAWYLIAQHPSVIPWVSVQGTTEILVQDTSSELYKETNKVQVGCRKMGAAKMLLPHAICKFGA